MTKRRIVSIAIVTAICVVILCSAGATLALNLSDSRNVGSVTTAGLKLSAKISDVKVYSAVSADSSDVDTFQDEYGKLYKYQVSNLQSSDGKKHFEGNRGSVSYDDKSITIENVLPGDKVEFKINITSKSSIAFKYRAELYVDASKGQNLLNKLDFSAGNLDIRRQSVLEGDESLAPAVFTDFTDWTTLSADKADVETVNVSVSLPINETVGQNETVQLYYVATAVQNTVMQSDVAEIVVDGEHYGYDTIQKAVDAAYENDVRDVYIKANSVLDEQEIIAIPRAMHFIGKADDNGNYPVVKGVYFVIEDGAAATFDSVLFTGDSYIDVSQATALTLTNCTANVTPSKYFDYVTKDFLTDSAFIVSASERTPVLLNVNNSSIVTGESAMIVLSQVSDGSVIQNNVFGSEQKPCGGSAAVCLNGAGSQDAVVNFTGNSIYAKRVLSLGNAEYNQPYMLVSSNNAAYGLENGIFVGGSKQAAFVDDGSTANGKALAISNLDYKTLLFGGVDVAPNSTHQIGSGKVALDENNVSIGEFFVKYTMHESLGNNAIELWNDNGAYAYLNYDGNNSYILTPITVG